MLGRNYVILSTWITHGEWVIPVVFGADHIDIHEWAGLRKNFFECQILSSRMSDFLFLVFVEMFMG